jgi:hypothetical protein
MLLLATFLGFQGYSQQENTAQIEGLVLPVATLLQPGNRVFQFAHFISGVSTGQYGFFSSRMWMSKLHKSFGIGVIFGVDFPTSLQNKPV